MEEKPFRQTQLEETQQEIVQKKLQESTTDADAKPVAVPEHLQPLGYSEREKLDLKDKGDRLELREKYAKRLLFILTWEIVVVMLFVLISGVQYTNANWIIGVNRYLAATIVSAILFHSFMLVRIVVSSLFLDGNNIKDN